MFWTSHAVAAGRNPEVFSLAELAAAGPSRGREAAAQDLTAGFVDAAQYSKRKE